MLRACGSKLIYSFSLFVVFCSCASFASDYGFEIIPLLGFAVGGSFEDAQTGDNIDVDEGFAYGLAINHDFNSRSQFQLLWARQETKLSRISVNTSRMDLTIDYFHFGSTYRWYDSEKSRAYIIASMGATYLNPDNSTYDDELYFSMGLGIGFKYQFTKHIGFIVEGRGLGTFMGGNTEIFCSSAGGCYIRTNQDLFIQFLGYTGVMFRF